MANQQARGHWPVPFARLLVFTLASLTPFQGDAQSKKCGSQYLGEEISYHNLAEYDETLGECKISMERLQEVCKGDMFAKCKQFLADNHKTKTGKECGIIESKQKMDAGGDPCCQYSDSRTCATFSVAKQFQNVAEECNDRDPPFTVNLGGHKDVLRDGEKPQYDLRLPMPSRICEDFLVGLRFPSIDIPQHAVIDSAYLLFSVAQRGDQVGDVELKVTVQNTHDAWAFTNEPGMLSSRVPTSAQPKWVVEDWGTGAKGFLTTAMSVDIASLISPIISKPKWRPKNALVVIIKPGSTQHINQRIAQAWDEERAYPAIRIVYHIDPNVAQKNYAEQGWSTQSTVLLMAFAGAVVGFGCKRWNDKYGRKRNKKYRTVAGDGEEMDIMGDNLSEDEEERGHAARNPTAKAYLSEGVSSSKESEFTYYNSTGAPAKSR